MRGTVAAQPEGARCRPVNARPAARLSGRAHKEAPARETVPVRLPRGRTVGRSHVARDCLAPTIGPLVFERFTDSARQAVVAAKTACNTLGHGPINSGHLLLGLLSPSAGRAHEILLTLGVSPSRAHRIVAGDASRMSAAALTGPPSSGVDGQGAFCVDAIDALKVALEESLKLGNSHIGSVHVLLGVAAAMDGPAAAVLSDAGVSRLDIRSKVIAALEASNGNPDDSAAASDQPVAQDSLPWAALLERAARPAGRPETVALGADATPDGPLAEFGTDLTALARAGALTPVVGRDAEVRRLMQILTRKTKNNPVLIGEPGVGKTAIAEGLAVRVITGQVPGALADVRVISLDLGAMVAGARYRGDFESRMKAVLAQIAERGDVVLFIDEIHTLVGAGSAEGAVDAANLLKPALARGGLRLIGATTTAEYRRYLEKDAALARRFQPIVVHEPTIEEAVAILHGARASYEAHHAVTVTDAALRDAVTLAARYIQDRKLPDKALDVLDEACSRARMEEQERAAAAAVQSDAATPSSVPAARASQTDADLDCVEVDVDSIAAVVAQWTGVPVQQVTADERGPLRALEATMHARIVGQHDAVTAIARAVRRSRTGLRDPGRPVGSFLFLGPSGVGKTEVARAIAEELYGGPAALVRVDLSEFMEPHTVARLIGSPPGYVGHTAGGQLTEAVRARPHSVVLFDEVEKAHPDVINVLLQVLDDGHLTDGQGRTIDFRNTIVVMTSNLGSRDLGAPAVGFTGRGESVADQLRRQVTEQVTKFFRPELLNRIDEQVVFLPLARAEIAEIVGREVRRLDAPLASHGIRIELDDSAVMMLADAGYDPMLGARPLRRAVQQHLEDPLAELLLAEDRPAYVPSQPVVTVRVHADGGALVLDTHHPTETQTPAAEPASAGR